MTRHWSRAIVSLGLPGGGLRRGVRGRQQRHGGLCPSKDAGQKDSTAPPGRRHRGRASRADDGTADATVGDATSDGDDGSGADDAGDDGATARDERLRVRWRLGGDGRGRRAGRLDGGGRQTADAGGDRAGRRRARRTRRSERERCVDPTRDPTADRRSGACNFAGTWGAEITIDVTWAAGGILDIVIAPGSGTIKQWLLSTRTQNGKTVTDTAVVCGIQLPDFQGNAAARQRDLRHPVPEHALRQRGPDPVRDQRHRLGLDADRDVHDDTRRRAARASPWPTPTTAVWPATITTEIDEDGDSKPGITANVVPPAGGFSYVPLDISVISFPTTVARADELYLAIRQVTSVSAQFTDCDHSAGSVTVPQITDSSYGTKKYAIDSHVIGCSVNGTGTDCSANQTTFVDENQPVFVPTATTYASARLPTGATCATVRSQFQ